MAFFWAIVYYSFLDQLRDDFWNVFWFFNRSSVDTDDLFLDQIDPVGVEGPSIGLILKGLDKKK
jgi:hypothetical protein